MKKDYKSAKAMKEICALSSENSIECGTVKWPKKFEIFQK